MRIIAIIANIGLIGLLGALFAKQGAPNTDEAWLVGFLCLTPVLNLIALFPPYFGKTWLGLYLTRKAMEEQKRIDELKR